MDWPVHKGSCARTRQINLKVFYPFIGYLFEYLRKIMSPVDGKYRHPGLNHNLAKAPLPTTRKAAHPDSTYHQTVVLDEEHGNDGPGLTEWVKFKPNFADRAKFWYQVTREDNNFELTTAISLILLAEIYSTNFEDDDQTTGAKPCFRLEHGNSPISDFGICKGRIRGDRNRLQVWCYVNPVTKEKQTVQDPDNYYWLYFRTILGEEVTLDCCSFSYGMDLCVDARPCLTKLRSELSNSTCKIVPAYFRTSGHDEPSHYTLIEEKRFSVMHNTRIHKALVETHRHSIFSSMPDEKKDVFRGFMEEVSGKPWRPYQEELFWWYRVCGGAMLRQVLSERHWKEWKKPIRCKGSEANGAELFEGSVDDFAIGLVELATMAWKDPLYFTG
ncbi:hypothetical protein P691DRAFT_776878 [Macrolepiota fuliginosa MF-IS2]|uniref:Uncharacterized protein n=1 Tax=Macrolepiota fuliginosa MF-IS2 TaxID=1400762 RepID=A0A9P5X7S8_9AGAR|nr:hypothetical protein P691DRAFT_776878 [Macrolepiota fuliginosa MF-IS2]